MALSINVADFIDARKPGGFQVGVVAMCCCVLFMDGYDTQITGYILPALAKSLNRPPQELREIFTLSIVGLMVGSLVSGPLADRFGRRLFVIGSTLLFGVCSLATAWADSAAMLVVLRFLTGLGLGGAMPNTVALGVEYFPRANKGFVTSSVWVGFSFGAAIAGFVAASLLERWGWPSVFIVGGVTPLLLAGVLALRLPESLRFLVLCGARSERIAATLRRVAPDAEIPDDAQFVTSEERAAGAPVAELFRNGRAPGTLVLWCMSFLALAVTFLMTSWLPTVFNQNGIDQKTAILALSMSQVGAVIGALLIGRLIDVYDRFATLAVAFLICAASMFALAHLLPMLSSGALLAYMLVSGLCQACGGTPGVNALTGAYFPTFIRSTGIGWSLGCGRVGSLFGIWLGGAMLAWKFTAQAMFNYVMISALVCAALALALRRVTPATTPTPVPAAAE